MTQPQIWDQPDTAWDTGSEFWDFVDPPTNQQAIDLIAYYVNLLIIQYHNKPKAKATIALYTKELIANAILLQIEEAYNLETAVGRQLDVLGKYEDIDRFYNVINLVDFFSIPKYADVDASTSPPQYGFETYATFDADDDFNGTLTYDKVISVSNGLPDNYFRTLIKLRIAQNTVNYSDQAINDTMFNFFGTTVRPEDMGNMAMAYFVTGVPTQLIQATLFKKVLLKPMAVGLFLVTGITGLMFGFETYDGITSPFAYGFADYADYDTLPGQTLLYEQISLG